MGRPPKFSADEILDATTRLVAANGPSGATVAAIAGALGAPTGSIYHRFTSRDLVLARVWIRIVKDAQAGFLEALRNPDLDAAALEAALHIPRWCRDHLDAARVLLVYRREDLVARWPDQLGAELEDLNSDLGRALRDHARQRFGSRRAEDLRKVTFALVDVPYGAVRRHLLAGEAPPPDIDELIRRTCTCILGTFISG